MNGQGVACYPWQTTHRFAFYGAAMENSPPGIQTIPFGAGPGANSLLEMVVLNAELLEVDSAVMVIGSLAG